MITFTEAKRFYVQFIFLNVSPIAFKACQDQIALFSQYSCAL